MKTLLLLVIVVAAVIFLLIGPAGFDRDAPVDSAPEDISPVTPSVRHDPTPHPAAKAQAEAIRLYPALGKKDSAMNKAFLALYEEEKRAHPESLSQPDWPLTLAKRAASSLPPPPTPKRKPVTDEDLWDAPDGLNLTIAGKVLSVTPSGVLLTDASIGIPAMKDVVTYRNPLDGSKRYKKEPGVEVVSSREPVFVYGVRGLVDGDRYSGRVCPASNYSYTAVSGASKTVRAFATSREAAEHVR